MNIIILDIKTPSGKWVGVKGLRNLTREPIGATRSPVGPTKTWTITLYRTIAGKLLSAKGIGHTLDEAIGDSTKKLDLLEKTA